MLTKSVVEVLDSTLREGLQAPGVKPRLELVEDFVLALDDLCIAFVEVGWPTASERDRRVFEAVKQLHLKCVKPVVFVSTRRPGVDVARDPLIADLPRLDVEWVTVFGKAWDFHVKRVLGTTLDENISMITDTIEYLRDHGIRVIFDAEHFFDGYLSNRDYALQVVEAAVEAGAERIVLADTRGGMLPLTVYRIVSEVVGRFKDVVIGVHMHDDTGCAVANTVVAVEAGARHIQVTVNGVGERVGNADLATTIANLELKLGLRVVGRDKLYKLRDVSLLGYKLLGLEPNPRQPYVGDYAFAHKAGVHIDAVMKDPVSYEHVDPSLVGNRRRFLASPLAGSAMAAQAARILGLNVPKSRLREVIAEFKRLNVEDATLTLAAMVAERLLGVKRVEAKPGIADAAHKLSRVYGVSLVSRVSRIVLERSSDSWEARVRVRLEDVEYEAARVGDFDEALAKALVDAAIVLAVRESSSETLRGVLPPEGPEER